MNNDRRRTLYVAARFSLPYIQASDFVAQCGYMGWPDAMLTPAQRRRVKHKRGHQK